MLEAAVAPVEIVPTDAVEIEARVAAASIALVPFLDSLVGNHLSVEQSDDPVSVHRYALLMSYHDERIALGVQVSEDVHYLVAGLAVEVTGRLIGQY